MLHEIKTTYDATGEKYHLFLCCEVFSDYFFGWGKHGIWFLVYLILFMMYSKLIGMWICVHCIQPVN